MRWTALTLALCLVGCGHTNPTEPIEVARCHTTINGSVYFYECGTTPPTEITLPMEDKQ